MARTNRKAFTLVEMLVVIVIISMLVALLVPAVIGARERARRLECLNRMSQAGKAILQYENAKGHLPGYVNDIGTAKFAGSLAHTQDLSWVVVVLENLGRADIWKEWRTSTGSRPSVALSEVLCPSDTNKRGQDGALSFVVNCGISDYVYDSSSGDYAEEAAQLLRTREDLYDSAWGLFYNQDASKLPAGKTPTTIAIDQIKDGATQTLMLSENRDATSWSKSGITPLDVGMVWWPRTAGGTPISFPWTGGGFPKDWMKINGEDPNGNRSFDRELARPSSFHPGGVNVVYADGHGDFLSERIDYSEYRNLLVSDQVTADSALAL